MTKQEFSELLDKKFAKLATKQDLEELEAWVAKIEKTMATKNDLKAMATKNDLKAMATKKQLSGMEKRISKRLKIIINFFDREGLEAEARIRRIERHFGFATT